MNGWTSVHRSGPSAVAWPSRRLGPSWTCGDSTIRPRCCGSTRWTRRSPDRTLQRKLDPDAPLFIDFDEHVRAYEGSDRQPVYIRH